MGDYQYDYGDGVSKESQDNFEVEFIDYNNQNKNFEDATEWATTMTEEEDDSFSFMDLFSGKGEFDGQGIDSGNLPPEYVLTPFPLRVIVAVLIPVGMLINISSMCHCRYDVN